MARLRTHGEDELVRAALRVADHVVATFGPEGIESVCGHPEIEVALAELSRATGRQEYLHQARLFVDAGGTASWPTSNWAGTTSRTTSRSGTPPCCAVTRYARCTWQRGR